jgi:cation:H+ antiporter
MSDYLTLAAGILLAGFGGEFFLRGLLGLAGWLRVAPGLIGATVAAFATSSPELSGCATHTVPSSWCDECNFFLPERS